MDITKTRRIRLGEWFSDRSIPPKEKSFISQLLNGKAPFGEKAARRLESTYGMPRGFLDYSDERSSDTVAPTTLMSQEEKTLLGYYRILLPEQRDQFSRQMATAAKHTQKLMEQVRLRLGLPEAGPDTGNSLPVAPSRSKPKKDAAQ